MKKHSLLFLLLVAILAIINQVGGESLIDINNSTLVSQSALSQNDVPEGFNRVIKVVDGDTISVEIDGKKQTVRMIGLNTPETVDPRKPVECFGKEASDYAKQILTDSFVKLESDSTQNDKDKYGRILRYAFLEDGTNFNKKMIEEGYGYEYTYEAPYLYQAEFKQSEKEARENKRGLWASGTCSKIVK